ncbi:minichromosome maintenance domain-containing protein 2-like isoform X1 [Cloeon dipterum]|uniref:minichromosome maintenance domain-containing protein 2-like isoform X1 n=2 Tax=Cloeon dipterum TaxID=197152 RepID=UPI00322044DE
MEFRMQKELLNYLAAEGFLQDLATAGVKYLQAISDVRAKGLLGPPLCFRPEINLTKLETVSEYLFFIFTKEPALVEKLMQQVALHVLRDFLGGKTILSEADLEQIHTPLRLCFDETENLHLEDSSKLQLVLITGVLSSYSSSSNYIRSSVSRCKGKAGTCPGAAPKRHLGAWIRGRLCNFCNSEDIEVPEERDVGEEVIGTLLPLSGLDCSTKGKTKAIRVIFRDDLSSGLLIGCSVQILCRPVAVQRSPNLAFLACSRPVSAALPQKIAISDPLKDLYAQYESSPWAAVAALSMHLGKEILPQGCLFNARMGMLLSMASQGSHRPLPLFILGRENILASKVMESAAKLAPRSVFHSCQNATSGIAKKSEEDKVDHFIEAGSLVLASWGVCFVGEWTGLKKEARTEILSAIEKGVATIKLPNNLLEFPMKASVWTYCHHLDKKLMKPVIDVFGLPITVDTTDEENFYLADYILRKALSVREIVLDEPLSEADLKLQIASVASKKVKVTEEAGNLIRNYFVASRRARANGGSSTEQCLPIGAVQNLTTMAEAHARLSLRSEALVEDAIVAIVIYEQTMVSLYGSTFNSPPACNLGVNLTFSNIHQAVDDYMNSMKDWVHNYVSSLLGIEE